MNDWYKKTVQYTSLTIDNIQKNKGRAILLLEKAIKNTPKIKGGVVFDTPPLLGGKATPLFGRAEIFYSLFAYSKTRNSEPKTRKAKIFVFNIDTIRGSQENIAQASNGVCTGIRDKKNPLSLFFLLGGKYV